jgi:hypothetical protein
MFISDPDRIRPKVSAPYGSCSGSGSGSATLFRATDVGTLIRRQLWKNLLKGTARKVFKAVGGSVTCKKLTELFLLTLYLFLNFSYLIKKQWFTNYFKQMEQISYRHAEIRVQRDEKPNQKNLSDAKHLLPNVFLRGVVDRKIKIEED